MVPVSRLPSASAQGLTLADGRGIVYEVRRSDRARRARLTITPAAEVVVVLPRRWPPAEAERLVVRHERWIARRVHQLRAEEERLAARPALGAGRLLEVEGRPLRVRFVDGTPPPARGSVRVVGDELRVWPGRDGREPTDLLERWLRARARRAVAARVAVRASEMDVRPGRLAIRDQTTRWASASRTGDLSFNWRLVLAPPEVLDAIVVHELAHLRVRGHTRAFWDIVERYAPQTPSARPWLRAHARELQAALE